MPTARIVDANGFMTVKGCPVSSWGIFEYSAGQIGLDGDPLRIVKVFRPKEALNNPKTIESFKNLPLIDDHEFLSGDDPSVTAPEEYGVEGIMTERVWFDESWLRADLKIFSRKLRKLIDSGKSDVSLGFDCDYVLAPGKFQGEAYEVVQDNIRGNHIAVVDEARVTGARVLDGKAFDYMRFDIIPSKKESVMPLKNKAPVARRKGRALDSNAVEQLKALLPALAQFLSEEATEPAHQGGEEPVVVEEPVVDGDEPTVVEEPVVSVEEPVMTEEPVASVEEPAAAVEAPAANIDQLIQAVTQLCNALSGTQAADTVEPDDAVALDSEGVALDNNELPVATEDENKAEEPIMTAKAADQALRKSIYADMAAKQSLYGRVSPIIGAFNHAEMSCDDLVDYSNKKLGIKANRVTGRVALDSYLMGVSKATKAPAARAADSAVASHDAIDQYLKGE